MSKSQRFNLIEQVKQEHRSWPLVELCRLLGVSRSGYWLWLKRQQAGPSAKTQRRQQQEVLLRLQVRAAHRRGRCYYGKARVHDELRDQGIEISRKRVARLMHQEGLVGRSRAPRRHTTCQACPGFLAAANLLQRRFSPAAVERVNRFWCGDITYLPTAEGWLYLAAVKDLFSRRIIGWAVADTLATELVEVAWQRALHTRGFSPQQGPELYHSDQGSQYASTVFQDLLTRAGTQASMSRRGNCLDNAVAESFFGTLKAELLADQPQSCFPSKAQAFELVRDYIENFYNPVRRHSALGSKSPIVFELEQQLKSP